MNVRQFIIQLFLFSIYRPQPTACLALMTAQSRFSQFVRRCSPTEKEVKNPTPSRLETRRPPKQAKQRDPSPHRAAAAPANPTAAHPPTYPVHPPSHIAARPRLFSSPPRQGKEKRLAERVRPRDTGTAPIRPLAFGRSVAWS